MEFQRWVLATVIALAIIFAVTGAVLLFEGIWIGSRHSRFHREASFWTAVALDGNTCTTPECQHYTKLISHCLRSGRNPCRDFSHFVCDSGPCSQLSLPHLYNLLSRATTEEYLYLHDPSTTSLTSFSKASSLYKYCRDDRTWRNSEYLLQFLNSNDLNFYKEQNTSAAELMMRLASQYQDGVLFWVDVGFSTSEHGKRPLVLKPNPHLERWVTAKTSLRHRRAEVSHALTGIVADKENYSDVVKTIVEVDKEVHRLWKATIQIGSLRTKLTKLSELNYYTIPYGILLKRIEDIGNFDIATDVIEVAGEELLSFLTLVLHIKFLQPYLVWEFVRHLSSSAITSALDAQETSNVKWIRKDACFKCIEDVTGLAAHAPFLFKHLQSDVQYKLTEFLYQMKNSLMASLSSTDWLTADRKDAMIRKLFKFPIVRGFPAVIDSAEKVDRYYSFLPNLTGNFWVDYYAAAASSWRKTLTGSSIPFPLLPTVPNVLTYNGTIFISAAMLMPPFFVARGPTSVTYASLGFAIIRAMLHNLGLSGFGFDHNNENNTFSESHIEYLSQCLALSPKMMTYVNEMVDALALRPCMRAFFTSLDSRRKSVKNEKLDFTSEKKAFFVSNCIMRCAKTGGQCNRGTRHCEDFADTFQCPDSSLMNPASKCDIW